MLEVSGLRVSYGGINAVRGIDLAVSAGEMVTLIGANGAGKTTTLKALTGLIRPAAGGDLLLEGRRERLAGAAPLGPEVRDDGHRMRAVDHEVVE